MENSRKLFIKAFLEAENASISNLKSENEIEWEFSEKFENSMNKLIKKNNHIQLSTRRTVRRGLLAAIIALIVAFTGLMSVSATRESIIEFVKKVFSQPWRLFPLQRYCLFGRKKIIKYIFGRKLIEI